MIPDLCFEVIRPLFVAVWEAKPLPPSIGRSSGGIVRVEYHLVSWRKIHLEAGVIACEHVPQQTGGFGEIVQRPVEERPGVFTVKGKVCFNVAAFACVVPAADSVAK